jgi:geranylgeranylglycerol-phosphate geranylgeranyltransferase
MSAFGTFIGAFIAGAEILQILYLSIAAFLIAGAGIILNDYYDYKIDKINAPHRPLPSGKIKKNIAVLYAVILFGIGIAIASFVNVYCLSLAILNTILEFLYARNFKQIAIIGNVVDSWFVASTFIFGALATLNFSVIWILSTIAFFANMGREIYGDIEDIEGDEKLGLKTLPIITNIKFAERVAQLFIIIGVLLSPLPYFLGLLDIKYLFVVILADVLFIYSLFQDPKRNQKLTKIAMILALFAFLVGYL